MGCVVSSKSKGDGKFHDCIHNLNKSIKDRNLMLRTSNIMAGSVKKIRKPKPWKLPQVITKSQLMQMREEFWDTAPHYGGRTGIHSHFTDLYHHNL